MKAFICMLGILLLVILLAGKLVLLLIQKGDEDEVPVPTPKPHIPVVQLLTNVWIMEADLEGLMIFRDGQAAGCQMARTQREKKKPGIPIWKIIQQTLPKKILLMERI